MKVCKTRKLYVEEGIMSVKSTEMLQRKSVICSVNYAISMGDVSDGDESSHGSSLVFEEDSDIGDDLKQGSLDQPDCIPSADPSEIECIITDTSGDESSDPEDCNSEEAIDKSRKQLSCSLCTVVISDVQDSPSALLEHLQDVHKFAVRRTVNHVPSSKSENDSLEMVIKEKGDTRQKKTFTCSKTSGGCGSVFFSKQNLHLHLARSKTAGGSCWLTSQSNQQRMSLFTCTICPFQKSSRKRIIEHMESHHNSDEAMNTFALPCRICDVQFWSVSDRSQHEVSEHSKEASYLMMKCYLCSERFSSKVCLKKHVQRDHSGDEQFSGDVGFRCRLCQVTFPTYLLVEEHFRKAHTSLLIFRCQKCNLILKTKKTFQVHLKSTQCGSIRQECTLCQKVLWSKRALAIHYRMKHFNSSRVGFLCRICKKRFDSESERSQHYTQDHEGDSPFTCPICKKGFASKSGMYGHRQTHMKTPVSKCEFCGKEFSRRDSYTEHLLIHTGPRHKCPHCDKEFVQRSNLVRHIRIHTGEKPYKCLYCEKSFSDKGACNSHIRVHTREEACGCPYCGQIFSKKQKLKYHIRKHTGEDLVSCEFCGKTFTNTHSLKEHRVIHDQRTQLLCSHCGKAFSTAKYLQRHIVMVHEAAVLYKCPLCSRGFTQQARLKTHLMTHTRVKHLQCLLCTKAYSTRKSLRYHLLNIHNITTEHADYKQCFYAMTPEEAGLRIPEGESLSKQPLLRPKSEPLSADSDLEDNSLSSEDEEDDSEPPHLVQRDNLTTAFLQRSSYPTIRTKAAMKQLPFSVTMTEKKGSKPPKSRDCEQGRKVVNQKQKNNQTRAETQVSHKEKLFSSCTLDDLSNSSSSSSEQSEPLSWKDFKSNKVNAFSGSELEELVPGERTESTLEPCRSADQRPSKLAKPSHRTRYKVRSKKKSVS